jgi:hypothetical protein
MLKGKQCCYQIYFLLNLSGAFRTSALILDALHIKVQEKSALRQEAINFWK